MARWEIDPDKFFNDVELEAEQQFRAIGFEALAAVQLLTPVDTGRLRHGWFITVNEPSEEESVPGGGVASLQNAKLTDTIILQDNVEYGPYVNYGTEHQAGQFFVERAIQTLTSEG